MTSRSILLQRSQSNLCIEFIDGNFCPLLRCKASGDLYRSRCLVHFAICNANSKRKLATKRLLEQSFDEKEALQSKITKQSAIRMHTYRLKRANRLRVITDTEIQRIAICLDAIKSSQEYVIIPNVISSSISIADITLSGYSHAIAFSNDKRPYLRWMQSIKKADYLLSVIGAIKHVFPMCDHIVMKLLTSLAGNKEQDLHADFVPNETTNAIRTLEEFHYSAIISIQEDTKLIVGEKKQIVDIPNHSMLFFRGDMVHAGAGYDKVNNRIFLSISSKSFPESDNVFIHTYSS